MNGAIFILFVVSLAALAWAMIALARTSGDAASEDRRRWAFASLIALVVFVAAAGGFWIGRVL